MPSEDSSPSPHVPRALRGAARPQGDGLRVLVVATKPPWPPIDGGRVLLAEQLRLLHTAGVHVTLVAPCAAPALDATRDALAPVCEPHLFGVDPAEHRSSARLQGLARLGPRLLTTPYSVLKHRSRAGQQVVHRLLSEQHFDVVHAEQLQALGALPDDLIDSESPRQPRTRLPPLVVRSQNVESDLWFGLSRCGASAQWTFVRRLSWFLARRIFAAEAARLRRYEVASLNRAEKVLAITRRDRERLVELGVDDRSVSVLSPPLEPELPGRRQPLEGDPALTILGSSGWLPNRLANEDFLYRVWPRLRRELSGAHLHFFGDVGDAVRAHARRHPPISFHSPSTPTAELFDPRATLLVPLDVGSGLRIKILDAFSRRVPVVASSCAAAGLHDEPRHALSLVRHEVEWPEVVAALGDRELRTRQVERGLAHLRAHHDPQTIGQELIAHYQMLASGGERGPHAVSTHDRADQPGLAQPKR